MDLKRLHYFATVAEEGSITAGAKKLFLSQPPLSAQLKELEKELGCVLFERGPRNITLTEPGKILYGYAKTILEISKAAEEEVQIAAQPDKGIVRIGMASSLVGSAAIRKLAEFSEENPGVSFEITERNTFELLKQIQADTLHLAFVRSPYPKGNHEVHRIASDRIVAIGQEHFFPEGSNAVRLKDLAQAPLILYRRWELPLRDSFATRSLSPYIRILADDARTVVSASEMGLGVGLVPESATETIRTGQGKVYEICDCSICSDIEVIWKKGRYLPGSAQRFLSFLQHSE